MIHAMLCSPAMRDGLTPPFKLIDDKFLDDGLRWKRIRQWAGDGKAAKILPWIALNPSGSNKSGHGLSGRTMAHLAYLWGFDGVATYNIVPFEGSDPKRDIWPRLRKGEQDQQIQIAHQRTAADLKDADALVVGWGSQGGELVDLARQLVVSINSERGCAPVRLWCVGLNKDRTPKHAGARGGSRIPNDARPLKFAF